jgi:hypothetical protein
MNVHYPAPLLDLGPFKLPGGEAANVDVELFEPRVAGCP